ncbi:MAG TPA: hypothetical protein VG165_12075 [Solirubrobacteraceae bacterium]|nr:hypothetical protein [Solirubrobacteraceae bacterium]
MPDLIFVRAARRLDVLHAETDPAQVLVHLVPRDRSASVRRCRYENLVSQRGRQEHRRRGDPNLPHTVLDRYRLPKADGDRDLQRRGERREFCRFKQFCYCGTSVLPILPHFFQSVVD